MSTQLLQKSAKRLKAIPRPKPAAQIISTAIVLLGSKAAVRRIRPNRCATIVLKPFAILADAEQNPLHTKKIDRRFAAVSTGELLKHAPSVNLIRNETCHARYEFISLLAIFSQIRASPLGYDRSNTMRRKRLHVQPIFGHFCIAGRRKDQVGGCANLSETLLLLICNEAGSQVIKCLRRFLITGFLAFCISGCSMLPDDGPSRRAIESAATTVVAAAQSTILNYALVDLNKMFCRISMIRGLGRSSERLAKAMVLFPN